MIKKAVLPFLLFPLFCLAITEADFFKKLNAKYSIIKNYKASFDQTNYWSEFDMEKQSKGTFYYSNENIALDYSIPKGQKLTVDSLGVCVYDVSSNQLIKTKADYVVDRIKPIEIMNYYKGISNLQLTAEDSYFVLEMLPKNDEQDIKKVILKVNKNTWLINELEYTDNSDNTVTYKFFNAKVNPKIPYSVFIIKTPDNVNIIDQRF